MQTDQHEPNADLTTDEDPSTAHAPVDVTFPDVAAAVADYLKTAMRKIDDARRMTSDTRCRRCLKDASRAAREALKLLNSVAPSTSARSNLNSDDQSDVAAISSELD